MQRQSLRFDKTPQPISICLRNKKEKLVIETAPYRVQLDNPTALKSIDNHVEQSPMTNMKHELSNIRKEVEKMASTAEELTAKAHSKAKQSVMTDSLKNELIHQREIEQNLKEQLAKLKQSLKQTEKKEELKAEQHIRELKIKFKKEKGQFTQKIGELEAKIQETKTSQSKLLENWKHQVDSLSAKLELQKLNFKKLTRESENLKKKLQSSQQQLERKENKLLELSKQTEGLEQQRTDLKSELKQRQHLIKRLNQQIQDISKESQLRLSNALLEFKKLEQRLNSNNQQTLSKFRTRVEELQTSTDMLRIENNTIRGQNMELNTKLDRSRVQMRQLKTANDELTGKLRNMQNELARVSHIQQVSAAQSAKMHELTTKLIQLETKYRSKCQQAEQLKSQTSKIVQINKLKQTNMKCGVELKRMQAQVQRLNRQLVSRNKQIDENKQGITLNEASRRQIKQFKDLVATLEAKCSKMSEQHLQIVDEYELKILKLENQVGDLKDESLFNQSSSRLLIAQQPSTATFDHALKNQLSDYDSLKNVVKAKQQQIRQLKVELEQARSKGDAAQAQIDMQKLLASAEEKKLRANYENTVENLKNEVEIQKRKGDSLQQKLTFKIAEIKKKDEFISQTIVLKVGKNDSSSEAEYIKAKLQEFIKGFDVQEGRIQPSQS